MASGRAGNLRSLQGISVLLVEDDEDTQATMRLMLEMEGARVQTARSAAEGLRSFFTRRPDVLVCDLGLPGADGYAFIRQIRELPLELGGSTGAVAVTAYAAEMPTKVLHAGFQAHLPKPVEPAHLVQAVATLAFKERQ
jgi:CheY-like chemotaxis protein